MKKQELSFLKILKKFFEPGFAFKYISLRALFPVVFWSLIWIIAVYLLKEITNWISNWFDSHLVFLMWIFIGLVLIHYLLLIISRNWTHSCLWPTFRKYMYKKYIKKFTYLDNNEAEKQWTWKLIAMIDRGMHSWVDLLVKFYVDVAANITFVLFSIIFIWFINIYYAFIVIIVFLLIFILTYFLQRKALDYRRQRINNNIWIMRSFVKVLMAKFEVLQNEKWQKEYETISIAINKNRALNIKVRNIWIVIDIALRLLIDGSKIFVILLFGLWLWNNVINFWEFVSLMSIVYILDQILTGSIHLYIEFTKVFTEVEKLWTFFDNASNIKWYDKWNKFKYKKWNIKIEKLCFWYEKLNAVFNNFDLKIKWWKVTAFVWNSWSGKSTLVKLIAGYIRSKRWHILIDNQKINKTSLKTYYKYVWYLTQEPSVFDGTILENLTYAVNRKLEKNEIEKVIKLSKCDFIYDLEKWVNTEIWERGVRLSWWQKQRLAIAKIFLKDSKIIILDEPTSALDSFSEEKITKAMHNLFKWRTVIIIAHRLQTVKHADEILLFSNWKIIEKGTHSELVKLKWKYAEMLKLQSGF